MKRVTAAVIEKDGRVLIAQRKAGDALAGKWEFPGGKLEPGETPEACLKRELEEEFGVGTEIGDFICSSEFEYKHFHIELLVYRARHIAGEFELRDHAAIAWVRPSDLHKYDLASADIPVVGKLLSAPQKRPLRRAVRAALLLLPAVFAAGLGWWLSLKPSSDRDWQPDAARTAWAEVDGNAVTVHNVRNFDYRTETDYVQRWETRSYDLSKIKGADLMLTYWDSPRIAHVVVSFPFGGGEYLAFSIETRRERGEEYSNFRGFFRQYELMCVAADERDAVRLRTNYRRGEETYLYRTAATPDYARALFLGYIERLNRLHEKPQWYGTLTNNCTNNVAAIAGEPRWDWRVVFSGLADRMLYGQGKLETGGLSFEELRAQAHINAAARAADKAADFSARIRAGRAGFRPAAAGL